MKQDDVPQDHSKTYGGHNKVFYAVDNKGDYASVHSSGWEVEELATHTAIAEISRQANNAWHEANTGIASPLAFHMYNQRMDLSLLAQTSGLYKWRIKRHFKPVKFNRLPERILSRYADALGLTITALKTLPNKPNTDG